MNNPFTEVMARQTDAELLRIVGEERTTYQPDAVQAAEQELEQRGLPVEYKERLVHNNTIRQQVKEKKASEPLEAGWKACILLFPGIGFISFVISGMLETRGYTRKASEVRWWIVYSWLFYILVFGVFHFL